MDDQTRQYITDELKVLLNRDPLEREIQNAVTDIYIMGRVRDRQLADFMKNN